jgi:acyl carrier protein
MNKNLIRAELAKLLDLPLSTITDELKISNVGGWDSIAWVSLVAFLIGELDCKIEIQKLMTIQTVGDLWALVETGARI